MEKDLQSLIFNYKKRQAMRDHPIFQKIKDIWDDGLYCTSSKTGCLNYLMKQIHENKTIENSNAIVKQTEWIDFYFNSGKKRKIDNENTYQSTQYYGRTIEELYELALLFRDDVNKKGFNINEQAALNIVIIKVIDDTFNDYMRTCNIIFKLKNLYPEFSYEISKPLESVEYGIDIIIKAGNQLTSAIKTLPRSALKKKEEIELFYKPKHETFKMIYNIDTSIVYSSINGFIIGDIPSF